MTKLYLRYLNDYDIIQLLNEKVPILIKQKNIEYHIERYNLRENNILKKKLDYGFLLLSYKRKKSMNVSFLQPIYPLHYCSEKNKILVKNAIKTYENELLNIIPHR